MTRLLNIGCGHAFHHAWVNLDAEPAAPEVRAWDIRRGLPFPEMHFEAAYGSHVLEHLEQPAAKRLLRELHRVLAPGGILRLAVPDLEAIAKLYLDSLQRAAAGEDNAAWRYDWAMLELYDQAVRSRSGGDMRAFLKSAATPEQQAFLAQRVGEEASPPQAGARRSIRQLARAAIARLRRLGAGASAFLFLGAEGLAALREGLFRRSGEVHQWMYDRYSLDRALVRAGFSDVRVCRAGESAIPRFADYALEVRDGRERKPDSLYVEARRP
jgi:SAM-dependent methyltransferase